MYVRSPLYLNCSKTKGVRFERSATISQGGIIRVNTIAYKKRGGIDRENMKTKNVDDTVRVGEFRQRSSPETYRSKYGVSFFLRSRFDERTEVTLLISQQFAHLAELNLRAQWTLVNGHRLP